MTRVALYPLGLVAKFHTGWTPPSKEERFYGGAHLWANIGDVSGRTIHATAKTITNEALREHPGARLAQPGDVLIPFKLSIGTAAIVEEPMYTNEAIATFAEADNPNFDMRYLYYILPIYVPQNAGVNIYDAPLLNAERIKNARIPKPPLVQQQKVADYLDRETAEIDAMIADLDEVEVLLGERRRNIGALALLDHPKVEHVAVGLLFESEDSLRVPVKSADRKEMAGDIPYYGASGVIDYVMKPIWRDAKRLLVSEDGANLMARSQPIAFLAEGDFWVNNHAHILRERAPWSYELAELGIELTNVEGFITGSAQPKLTADNLMRMRLPWLIEEDDRRAVIENIQRDTAEIDSMLADIHELRALLAERRSALITAAVTGQIDIPELTEAHDGEDY